LRDRQRPAVRDSVTKPRTSAIDPRTVIIVLALNLLSSGGLFYLIARKLPPHGGLGAFSAGAVTFGAAYAVRLAAGAQGPAAISALTDCAMIVGTLPFAAGVRQFVDTRPFRIRAPMLADVLTRLMRADDFVARTGGEGFLVACVDASADTACLLAERLRVGEAELRIRVAGQSAPLQCTVSIGVSHPFSALRQWEQAARQADDALYKAKAAGRNQVVLDAG